MAKPCTAAFREVRRRDPQVVPERPVDEALAAAGANHRALDAGGELREQLLCAQHPAELQLVLVHELFIYAQRRLAILAALDHGAQLVAELDAEVESGPDPLGGERQAVAGGVADAEDPVLGARADLVRDPVALVANRVSLQVLRVQHGGVLDVEAGVERAHADALLAACGEAPAVPGRDVAPVDPNLEVVASAVRVNLEAA